ncbi:amino acid ABC transporter permease [Streptococcus suis]|nr:amino acid ABC transporter permease [Streptococcus suis]NQK19189.1 amino acid ABC transporter permease [Streptococcus suis]
MDWNFIQESIPVYQEAFILTIRLAFLGIIGAFSLGLIISIIRYYRIPVLQQISTAYIELSRNTPLVIQLFFLYYGLPRLGIVLDAEVCAIAGLIFLGGSSFRSGFEAIKKSQIEIGASLGLTNWQIFQYILLPQSLAIALPSFSANVIFLIKETSVFSIIALADLMYVAQDLIGLQYETDEALFLLVSSYLIVLLPLSLFFYYLERRIRHAGYGH